MKVASKIFSGVLILVVLAAMGCSRNRQQAVPASTVPAYQPAMAPSAPAATSHSTSNYIK